MSQIISISHEREIVSVSIEIPAGWEITLGESIAIDGICSTVSNIESAVFTVQYMPETLRKTTVSYWKQGDFFHLEKSLKVGQSLDGHFVLGHIDTVATLREIRWEGDSSVVSYALPAEYMHFVVQKGSVTIDGVSLTVSGIDEEGFEVSLIPFTLSHTHLGRKKVGDVVNIETDILAKYITRNHS